MMRRLDVRCNMLWHMVMSEWSDEILFPVANAEGYRLVFEAETWLRRMWGLLQG